MLFIVLPLIFIGRRQAPLACELKKLQSHSRSFKITGNYTNEWGVSKVLIVIHCSPILYGLSLLSVGRSMSQDVHKSPFGKLATLCVKHCILEHIVFDEKML